ncbi:MAG: hypothetical protein IT303_08990 [Dehalococcoidia bacterium]|nr:hypothetical protein [Dehalococcoidia bacterium]
MTAPSRPLPAPGEVREYRVRAHNGAVHSTNKIHDDTVAKEYGFAGGLVPGVTVYAYMARLVVELFGPAWLGEGRLSGRFHKPLYEGELATVRVTANAGGTLAVEVLNPAGDLCATGEAGWLPEEAVIATADLFPRAALPNPRPPASQAAFRASPVLGSLDETFDAGEPNETFLAEIADDLPLWHGGAAVAHPGWLIRKANAILVANADLGPWIHVSSDAIFVRPVAPGTHLSTRAQLLDVFERKGHKFVDLDVAVFDGDDQLVMRAHHTSIYEPRRAATD